jgi:clan AA aspartic protease (TIGR02281 family)
MRRTGDRTLRLALLVSAGLVLLLIAAIGLVTRLASPEQDAARAPAQRSPSPPPQSAPAAPAPSGPSRSTLVLDWAESERAEAIRRMNEAESKKTRLGPGTMFVSIGKKLEGLEAKVFSESIPLRRGDGNLWYVPVVFNGKSTQEMAIDTGASVVALSWETALSLGLSPPADSRTVYVQVADGSIVPCKQVFAETVRVGKFTVEKVECTVLPAGLRESTPLLGLSFFKNFSFQIDSGSGRLIMSQIDTSDTE